MNVNEYLEWCVMCLFCPPALPLSSIIEKVLNIMKGREALLTVLDLKRNQNRHRAKRCDLSQSDGSHCLSTWLF